MAVNPADLLTPLGRLDRKVLWPGTSSLTVTTYLPAYLADAAAEAVEITDTAANDKAQKWWAYYRAYDEVYQRLLSQPASVSDSDEGSQSYLVAQIEMMRDRAGEALTAFNEIVEAETATDPEEDSYTVLRSMRD